MSNKQDPVPKGVVKRFEQTPRKLHYQLKVVTAAHRESLEVVLLAEDVNLLMERAPERIMNRILREELKAEVATTVFRELRDAIHALKDKIREVGRTAQMECELGEKRRGRGSNKSRAPGKGKSVSPDPKPSSETENPKGDASAA